MTCLLLIIGLSCLWVKTWRRLIKGPAELIKVSDQSHIITAEKCEWTFLDGLSLPSWLPGVKKRGTLHFTTGILTLTALWVKLTGDNLIFFLFSRKIGFDFHANCSLFTGKNKKNILKCQLLIFLPSMLGIIISLIIYVWVGLKWMG